MEAMRHSAAHVMAAAVCRLHPDVKLDIGPATADGFYYDFDLEARLAPEDFPRIEAVMAEIVAADLPFERLELDRETVRQRLSAAGQTFKLDRLKDIPEDQPITLYRCGEFEDLCRGPHLESTGAIQAFKLVSVAGSYFRGIETQPMLQRIYGIAAETGQDLAVQIQRLEEAQRRDHRRIGRALDLFSIQDAVGPGLVHWHPRGARLRSVIEDFWRREHFRGGYELLYTPHIGRAELWETSGHLGFYRENMYAPIRVDSADYFLKPMNCPFHIQVYRDQPRSHRDLPIRWAELGTVYRYEKSGVLHGLKRVRGFTQDDAHIFCAPDRIGEEVGRTVAFALRMLRRFGFDEISAYLATRPDQAVGDPQRWEQATLSLREALRDEKIPFVTDPGGGAFYGPKIDLKIRDAIGREWQLSTIQFDFNLPERFDLSYTGTDGKPHRPYMVHRALLGSLERFFGILIEHYAGAFPLWLAPEQIRLLPVGEQQQDYAQTLADRLRSADFRAEVDTRSEKIGAKIRRAQLDKIPRMLIVGAREAAAGTVSVRCRDHGDQGVMELDAFFQTLRTELEPQSQGG